MAEQKTSNMSSRKHSNKFKHIIPSREPGTWIKHKNRSHINTDKSRRAQIRCHIEDISMWAQTFVKTMTEALMHILTTYLYLLLVVVQMQLATLPLLQIVLHKIQLEENVTGFYIYFLSVVFFFFPTPGTGYCKINLLTASYCVLLWNAVCYM